jgi:hypothetical protein
VHINDHVQNNEQKKASSIIKEYDETQMKKCNFLVHLRDAKFGISEEKNLRSTCSRLFPTTVSNLTQLPFQAQEEVNMRA